MSEPVVIAVDLGGTMVRVGALSTKGSLLMVQQDEIQAINGPQAGIHKICNLIEEVAEKCGGAFEGIGVSCTGPLDLEEGVIHNPYTLPTWEHVPIVSELQNKFEVPVALENDGDAAALGEYWQGAGRGIARVYAVTVGTGIGTSFIHNGEVLRGINGFHPEGGHHVIDPAGPLCYCGLRGCWESLASGTAIARQARLALKTAPDSLLMEMVAGNVEEIDTRMVTKAAREGDATAQRVISTAASYLGLGITNVVMFFMPEIIILSGGVMQSAELFLPHIHTALEAISGYVPAEKVQVVKAQLGYYANLYGAAYSIIQRLNNNDAE
jgi:glucokinase